MLLQVAIFVEEREDSYTSEWAITYVVDEAKLNSEWSVLLEILGISLQAIESIARGATQNYCRNYYLICTFHESKRAYISLSVDVLTI